MLQRGSWAAISGGDGRRAAGGEGEAKAVISTEKTEEETEEEREARNLCWRLTFDSRFVLLHSLSHSLAAAASLAHSIEGRASRLTRSVSHAAHRDGREKEMQAAVGER